MDWKKCNPMASQDTPNSFRLVEDLVSVIVPAYNCERYLRQCIDSIIEQSYKNIEIILVDDGSTDNTGEMCDAYAARDKRIRVIHTKNSGPAAARNIAIRESEGSLIFFLDADDSIDKEAVNELVAYYRQYEVDMVVGDFHKFRYDHTGIDHEGAFPDSRLLTKQDIIDYTRSYLKKPNKRPLFTYSWGRLFKAVIIKEHNIVFDERLHTFEDVTFNFEYLKYTDRMFFLKRPLYNHLVHDNYASASLKIRRDPESLFGYRKAMARAAEFLEGCNAGIDVKREVGHAYTCYTIIQLVRTCGQINKENTATIRHFIKRFVHDPELAGHVPFYTPSKGDSRVLPILLKLKLARLIMLVCQYKARKRYGKK